MLRNLDYFVIVACYIFLITLNLQQITAKPVDKYHLYIHLSNTTKCYYEDMNSDIRLLKPRDVATIVSLKEISSILVFYIKPRLYKDVVL